MGNETLKKGASTVKGRLMAKSLTATVTTGKVTRIMTTVMTLKASFIRPKDTMVAGAVILTTTAAVKLETDLTSAMEKVEMEAMALKNLTNKGANCKITTAMEDKKVIQNTEVAFIQGQTTSTGQLTKDKSETPDYTHTLQSILLFRQQPQLLLSQ